MTFEQAKERLSRLRQKMSVEGADVFVLVVTERYNSESMAYISGFRGSSGAVLVSPEKEFLVTDGRYALQAADQSPFEIILQGSEMLQQKTAGILGKGGWKCAAFEGDRLSVSIFRTLEKAVPSWKDCSHFLPSLRTGSPISRSSARCGKV